MSKKRNYFYDENVFDTDSSNDCSAVDVSELDAEIADIPIPEPKKDYIEKRVCDCIMVNVREEPSETGRVLGQLLSNMIVQSYMSVDGFDLVQDGHGISGYVMSKYLKEV